MDQKVDLTAPHSVGTTVIGVTYNGGAVLGADSRTNTGVYGANRASDKITQLTDNVYVCRSGSNFMQDDDNRLEITRTRFGSLLKRHGDLTERLARDSDKIIFERLQKEFEAARASQTEEICLDGDAWNDGLLATIRERVHMESDRKAMHGDADILSCPHEKITYKIGNKVICCLEGARIGVQYETSYAGEPCDFYHCVLESKSFLEKMTVLEHTVPFFLPIREIENDLLSSNAMKFIDHVGDLLQAFVDRREQVDCSCQTYKGTLWKSNQRAVS
ncbi:hypothetical protein PHAVU_009G101000 [Phaseolus vulgaris]|uniref:Uncharacterized protein n=1 Tax=Phaseolus vulgaris TaxID=3885 RepID=V7AXZ9_PHAVU|nr:hypothetical protein PHAVU_009G101000g [Phaseolus vulgaris]ESW09111.1 hypothetical protein PHAVU_009G101000g [Phaseolus vulgaris]